LIPKAFVAEKTRFSERVVDNFHFYCFEANDKNSGSDIFLLFVYPVGRNSAVSASYYILVK